MKKIALYLLAGTFLLGCGGDDSNSSSGSGLNVELLPGVYTGVTSEGEYLEGLVDDNKRIWFVYSENEDFLGFINSNDPVVPNNGNFMALGKNYSFDSRNPRSITIDGDYRILKTLKGKISEPSSDSSLDASTISYNLGYDENLSAIKLTLDRVDNKIYNGISHVTGDINSSPTTIKFTTDGNFTIDDSGECIVDGKFTPSASGRYFISTVKFSGTLCTEAGENYTGVAILEDGDELLFVGAEAMQNKGLAFVSLDD